MNMQFAENAFNQLFKTSDSTLLNNIEDNPNIPKKVALSIYRNNAIGAQLSSLKSTYKVCEHLVGETCFKQIALTYLQTHPMHTRDLNTFAITFPSFIHKLQKQETSLQQVPYLPDVAQWELYLNLAYYGDDLSLHPPFDTEKFSELTDEAQGLVTFTLNPELNLLNSEYPIEKIWLAHQKEEIIPIELKQDNYHYLIYRPAFKVETLALSLEKYQFLEAIRKGFQLKDLCHHFPAQIGLLGNYIQNRWLIGSH